PSIEDYLTPMFKSNGDANFAMYTNPALDAVLAKGDAEPDPEKAIKLYQQAEDIALEDMPLIPLYTKSNAYLHSAKIEPRVSKYVGVSALWATVKVFVSSFAACSRRSRSDWSSRWGSTRSSSRCPETPCGNWPATSRSRRPCWRPNGPSSTSTIPSSSSTC